MKFLIFIRGNPIMNGYVRREFRWVPQQELYLWQGREVEAHEFNAVMDTLFKTNRALYAKMYPEVRIVASSEKELPVPTGPREITVGEAEEVMEKYAPHRLKRKPGPQPTGQPKTVLDLTA